MDREAWWATVHGVTKVRHNLVTKQQQKVIIDEKFQQIYVECLLCVQPQEMLSPHLSLSLLQGRSRLPHFKDKETGTKKLTCPRAHILVSGKDSI